MKCFLPLVALLMALPQLNAEEASTTNLPPDPFGSIDDAERVGEYPIEVDRTRGAFTLDASDGQYQPGSHFANWFWNTKIERWGNYYVGLLYESSRPKLGVQLRVGDSILKGYAPRTNALMAKDPMILGKAYIPKPDEYSVSMLTGDQSNVPTFQVKGIHFSPAPENEPHGQSIDGSIVLDAATATTYSEKMRYEPNEEKNCLGFWTEVEDWAEWTFDITTTGKFQMSVFYGCGDGAGGSEVAIYLNDQTHEFTVSETGGFQEWKELDLGVVSLDSIGENKLAVIPKSKGEKAVMDVQKIVLTPKS
ncbi:MAG: hypothetical protein P1U58_03435 [Verrucomicrobiales bacterium]|nr:hypothetical protein [Verrucomicrobiales bacterium]